MATILSTGDANIMGFSTAGSRCATTRQTSLTKGLPQADCYQPETDGNLGSQKLRQQHLLLVPSVEAPPDTATKSDDVMKVEAPPGQLQEEVTTKPGSKLAGEI